MNHLAEPVSFTGFSVRNVLDAPGSLHPGAAVSTGTGASGSDATRREHPGDLLMRIRVAGSNRGDLHLEHGGGGAAGAARGESGRNRLLAGESK